VASRWIRRNAQPEPTCGPGSSHPPATSVRPLAGTRAVIARRMLASLQGSAQYTLVRAVDVTELADRHDRAILPAGVTYTDAVARAVALSLAAHPDLNAHITGEEVLLAAAIDLGIGIDSFPPIINPPEVAILGVGRITDSPAPSDAGITWRKSMTLSLTVDHRAVDGAPAARFPAGVADRLQAPAAL